MNAQLNPQLEPTRTIRALARGLDVLTELNRLERGAINQLAAAVNLPRTTIYRILETLRLAGFVERDEHDDCYRPTVKVRELADGFDDKAMIAHVAKPHLSSLGEKLVWPVAISTLSDIFMVVRECTDSSSPLSLTQEGAGLKLPLLSSAPGRAYLAFCDATNRSALLELLARSSNPEGSARNRTKIEAMLNETRTQGFATAQRARRISEEISLAIPVRAKDQVLAAISVSFAATAVPLAKAIEQFLPKMRETAQRIETQFA